MQGAAIVLRTLVPNARRIFQILAEQQMQDPENGVQNSSYRVHCTLATLSTTRGVEACGWLQA